MSESRTQLPARRPVDCVDASGRGTGLFPHGRLRFSHSEQVPLRRPSGSDIVCFGRSLCGARAVWQSGSGLPGYFLALRRRGAALRCAAAAIGTVASIGRLWLPFCGRGASLVASLGSTRVTKGTAHSIATSPRAENSERGYAAAAYVSWGTERPAGHRTRTHRVGKGLSQVICAVQPRT